MEKKYGVDDIGIESISNPTRIYSKITKDIHNEILDMIGSESGQLENMDTLERINEKLEEKFSFLVVKKNGKILFNGGDEHDEEIEKLPDYQDD